MKPNQNYNCFPKYISNTAFGSLLTGLNCNDQIVGIGGEKLKVDDGQYSENLFGKIPTVIDDHFITSTQICNNSAWNNDHNLQQQQQPMKDIFKILTDFLGEFLLFLSSIIRCEQFYSQLQLQKMLDVAERIYQLRLTLLTQINNPNEHITNSTILDIRTVFSILQELASFIHCLGKEQKQIGTIIEHSHTAIFTQLLNRLEKIIKSCMDCVSLTCDPQRVQTSMPVMFPCLTFPDMIGNPTLSTECCCPCNGFNMSIPWSCLEQMKNLNERDHRFGIMYGIKDEKIRRKLGYGIRKHKSPNRKKQKYKRKDLLNEKQNFDRYQERTASSTDDHIPVIQKTSVASTKEKLKNIEKKDAQEKTERISTNSIISSEKNTTNRIGSNRTTSRQQSIVNSKRSSPLFSSNLDIHEPLRLRSKQNRLTVSDSGGRIATHGTSSRAGELPITSMLDRSESQRTASRLIQQSTIYKEDDDKSALSSSLSFQTYGYQTPSKTTIKVSRESSQSLSPVHNKSISTRQSNDSILSQEVPSINEIREKKSTSNVTRSNDKQTFNKSIHEQPISYQTHADDVDSPVTFASHDKINHSESKLNKSWEQRLASPLSLTSVGRINSTHPNQSIVSPISNKQLSINETTSDFNFDNYSEHQMSPSISFLNETNDNISSLNVIEERQSAKGKKNTSDSNTKYMSTSHFPPINTYRQRSTNATSDNNDSPLFPETRRQENKKHSSRSITRKTSKDILTNL